MVLILKGCLGGDVGAVGPEGFAKGDIDGIWVPELGLGLLNMCVEGFFFLLVKLLASGVDEIVEGYLDEDVVEGRPGNGTGITRRYPRPLKRAQDHPNQPRNEGDMVKTVF